MAPHAKQIAPQGNRPIWKTSKKASLARTATYNAKPKGAPASQGLLSVLQLGDLAQLNDFDAHSRTRQARLYDLGFRTLLVTTAESSLRDTRPLSRVVIKSGALTKRGPN